MGRPVQHHPKPNCAGGNGVVMPQTSDYFDGPHLGLQWQWHADHKDAWYSLSERPGHLRLYPQPVETGDFSKAGNLLLQKFPAREFSAETELELPLGYNQLHAGLIVMGEEYCAMDVQRDPQGYHLRLVTKTESLAEFVCDSKVVHLRVAVGEGGVCRFGVVRADGSFYILGPAFHARPGRWIGAKVGIYCTSLAVTRSAGHADFAHFTLGNHL